MRPYITRSIAFLFGLFLLTGLAATAAQAQTTGDTPSFSDCKNLTGWYGNADEQSDLPTPTADGLLFDKKDLIHHATSPMALADVKGGTFEATNAGKVVFKMETTNPYSTIVQNADGKFWSSRLAYAAPGGQGNPVSVVTDMIGSETKTGNPKYTNDTHVTTFGVGYWVEEGDTVVSSISFHGTKYPLTCKPASSSPSASTSTSVKPSASTSTSTSTKPSASASGSASHSGSGSTSATSGAPAGAGSSGGPSLPLTGPSIGIVASVGALILAAGGALLFLSRRRRATFSA